MTERQRRLITHGTLKLEHRTEKPRVGAGKSSFPSSPAASSTKPCTVGGRSGGRETKNAKASAALELGGVVVATFCFSRFVLFFPKSTWPAALESQLQRKHSGGFCLFVPFLSKIKLWMPFPSPTKQKKKRASLF